MKKEIPGNASLRTNLRHEYSLHGAVVAAFDRYDDAIMSSVRVPRLSAIIYDTDADFWAQNLHRFPGGYGTRSTVVKMERILPLPKVIRKALITEFYPAPRTPLDSETLSNILNDTPNKHCLSRTYLGRANGQFTKERFSLRNFPLYLEPMEPSGFGCAGSRCFDGKSFCHHALGGWCQWR